MPAARSTDHSCHGTVPDTERIPTTAEIPSGGAGTSIVTAASRTLITPATTTPSPKTPEDWTDLIAEVARIENHWKALSCGVEGIGMGEKPARRSLPHTEWERNALRRRVQALMRNLRPDRERLEKIITEAEAEGKRGEHTESSVAGSRREECIAKATTLRDQIQATHFAARHTAQLIPRPPDHPNINDPGLAPLSASHDMYYLARALLHSISVYSDPFASVTIRDSIDPFTRVNPGAENFTGFQTEGIRRRHPDFRDPPIDSFPNSGSPRTDRGRSGAQQFTRASLGVTAASVPSVSDSDRTADMIAGLAQSIIIGFSSGSPGTERGRSGAQQSTRARSGVTAAPVSSSRPSRLTRLFSLRSRPRRGQPPQSGSDNTNNARRRGG